MPNLEITRLTPNDASFNIPDLQRFLAGENNHRANAPGGLASEGGATRTKIPGRPSLTMQWQDIETVGDTEVPDIFRPLTPDNAEEYVRDYEGELSSLALAGADTPPHTIYMTGEDQHNNRPARIYTIAHMPEGRYLTGRYIHDPDSTAHKKFLVVAKTIFSYHTTPSLRPWRIETAAMTPSYAVSSGRERLEFTDLAPALVEKRQAATAALNGLVHYLTPTARPGGSQQGMELLGEVFGCAIKHGVELNSPPEQTI